MGANLRLDRLPSDISAQKCKRFVLTNFNRKMRCLSERTTTPKIHLPMNEKQREEKIMCKTWLYTYHLEVDHITEMYGKKRLLNDPTLFCWHG